MKCVLSLNVLYPYFKGYFSLGAGRECEATTQRGKKEVREAHIPPFPFRFSPRAPLSSFPFPLSAHPQNLFVAAFFSFHLMRSL